MILQSEIRQRSSVWEVPPTTVEKDHALGHFLAAITRFYGEELSFKGGTCLRKCYFPEYRFSEDLDFSSVQSTFQLTARDLLTICQEAEKHAGIIFHPDKIEPLKHKNIRKGDQVMIRFWGAYHPKHEEPSPVERWHTKIKLEISTDELLILPTEYKSIHHPYTDAVLSHQPMPCYSLDEVVAEKLRALVQRKYTAPRDFYDLYNLTTHFSDADWNQIKPVFLAKMKHKGLEYSRPEDLVTPKSTQRALKAWHASIDHQVTGKSSTSPEEIIIEVRNRILQHL